MAEVAKESSPGLFFGEWFVAQVSRHVRVRPRRYARVKIADLMPAQDQPFRFEVWNFHPKELRFGHGNRLPGYRFRACLSHSSTNESPIASRCVLCCLVYFAFEENREPRAENN